MNIVLAAINAKYVHVNLAVRSIYEYCAEYKEYLDVMEFTINQDIDLILTELYNKKPYAVCFSCYIWNTDYVMRLSKALKLVLPNVLIVTGGPEASYDIEYYLTFSDLVVIGEGEETMRELISLIINGGDYKKAQGIVYYENNILKRSVRKPLDMAQLAFPYSGLPDDKILYYESSRGCPFKCQYCLSSSEKGVRLTPLDKVYRELNIFIKGNVKQVKFVDRTFNCNAERAYNIWKYIIENDNGFTNFHFEIAADLLNGHQLTLLKTARVKLFQFEIGVQSTNTKTLNEIDRETNLDKLFSNVNAIKSLKSIEVHLDLIAGLPDEDYTSFIRSFNDVYALNPDQLQLGFLKALKGSALRSNAEKHGIKYREYAPYEVTETNLLTFDELIKLKRIEDVLNLYYNTNRYNKTLSYSVPFFETPFNFFEKLAVYWTRKRLYIPAHSKMQLFTILYEFLYEELQDASFAQYLKYDLYLCENIKTAPYWFEMDSIPKRHFYENKSLISKYLPHMEDKNSSQINRVCNIVKCSFEQEYYFLLDYSDRDKSVLYSNATATVYDITDDIVTIL